MIKHLFNEKIDIEFVADMYKKIIIPYTLDKIKKMEYKQEKSEKNPLLTKVVVDFWEDLDIELRFHFYDQKTQDPNIHDHRWSFYSFIVCGEITEIKYKKNHERFVLLEKNTYKKGDVYQVKESDFHTAFPSEDLITLLLRGRGNKNSWDQFDIDGNFLKSYPFYEHNPNEEILSPDICEKYLESAKKHLLTQFFNYE